MQDETEFEHPWAVYTVSHWDYVIIWESIFNWASFRIFCPLTISSWNNWKSSYFAQKPIYNCNWSI